MKKIKVFALLATLFVGIFSNFFTPVVSAEETPATVTIHKLQGKTGPIVNTGNELSGYIATDFLDGITYNVYNVTAAYHTKYNEVYTPKTAQDADNRAREYVQGTAGHAPTVSGATLVGTKITTGGGAATFTLPKTYDGKNAVYVFVEQPKTGITAAEKNLVLSFPVYELNSDSSYTDKELTEIHLYPKNTTETIAPVKEITTKKSDGAVPVEHNNYNVGQAIGFKLSTKIPANIGIKEVDGRTPYYNTFGLIDTHDTTLTFDPKGTHKLKVPKVADTDTDIVLEEITDYTIEVGKTAVEGKDKDTFKVKLTQEGINKLAEQGGKTLEFTYTMKLNNTAVMDSENVNQVTVEYGHKTNDETSNDVVTTEGNKTKVYTGGYRFIKTDVSTNKPLADAEFVVRDADTTTAKYLKIDAGTKEISWVDTYDAATKFTTAGDGIVDIKGLTYGNYYLEETKAPTDYVKLPDRIGFTVAFNSYIDRKTITPAEVKEHPVVNTPKGFLPKTGGAGIILFVALGAAMVGLAGVYFTSRRKDA
ncbi:SpaH/EbpB family LPXTG-anchored major pilin [Streptococcus parasuis]|uniref:SpaH/EbpB family LPXTG-anchored major pilin n=1 Tax=Streptococcus parasuis TaxID=1501662 RepID=UPI0028B11B28|nr:SpaH/EbpB family LPXTG-anchored major pilin [Streptococcus parasuis]